MTLMYSGCLSGQNIYRKVYNVARLCVYTDPLNVQAVTARYLVPRYFVGKKFSATRE